MAKQDYSKMNKSALIAAVMAQDEAAAQGFTDMGRKATKALIITWLEAQGARGMAATLRKYRGNYTDCVAYSGRLSLSNGDEVAQFLEGMSPEAVLTAAERILGLDTGELTVRYVTGRDKGPLNPGQCRMNGGNLIRAAFKRGDISAKDLH